MSEKQGTLPTPLRWASTQEREERQALEWGAEDTRIDIQVLHDVIPVRWTERHRPHAISGATYDYHAIAPGVGRLYAVRSATAGYWVELQAEGLTVAGRNRTCIEGAVGELVLRCRSLRSALGLFETLLGLGGESCQEG